MNIRKVALMAAVLLFTFTSAALATPTINIYDTDDWGEQGGAIFSNTSSLGNLAWTYAPDYLHISGSEAYFVNDDGHAAIYGIRMLEPGSGAVSDFATLTVGEYIYPPEPGGSQDFDLRFWSDGATGFEMELAKFDMGVSAGTIAAYPDVIENGSLQTLFKFSGTGQSYSGIEINALSTKTVVPEPISMLLVATGLVGMGVIGRKKLL